MKNIIYLDHNATTPVRDEVFSAMEPYFRGSFGNPSSLHAIGRETKKAIDDARSTVARLLNASRPEEVVFTSGGTEADNMAVQGFAYMHRCPGNHIITTRVEHPAVLDACRCLEKQGFTVTYLPVDRHGQVTPESVREAIRPTTILVSVMHANNEVGTVEPLADIARTIQELNLERVSSGKPRIVLHTDAVQTAGKLPLDVQSMGADMLSLSAHKFYGPKGTGVLYLRRGTAIHPLFHGGHQEGGRRAGTENTAGAIGLAHALELADRERMEEQSRLSGLTERLELGLRTAIPAIEVHGRAARRLAGTLSVSFRGIEGESLLLMLDMEGIAVSTGSACASGSLEPSHVLSAMGIEPELAQGTLRFSLGRLTADEDIDRVLKVLPGIVSRLRSMSPIWNRNAAGARTE